VHSIEPEPEPEPEPRMKTGPRRNHAPQGRVCPAFIELLGGLRYGKLRDRRTRDKTEQAELIRGKLANFDVEGEITTVQPGLS